MAAAIARKGRCVAVVACSDGLSQPFDCRYHIHSCAICCSFVKFAGQADSDCVVGIRTHIFGTAADVIYGVALKSVATCLDNCEGSTTT